MNKTYLTLYGILAFWLVVLLGVFAFHVAVPVRFLFLVAFICVGWLAWWTINTVRRAIREDTDESSTTEPVSETKVISHKNKNKKNASV